MRAGRFTRRLFDKRKLALNPALDARLSFTSAHGILSGPAWKTIFYNPKTDAEAAVRLIRIAALQQPLPPRRRRAYGQPVDSWLMHADCIPANCT